MRERFHKTILQEFYQVTVRKKLYQSIDVLQADLDERPLPALANRAPQESFGRPLFASLRGKSAPAEQGGGVNPLMNL